MSVNAHDNPGSNKPLLSGITILILSGLLMAFFWGDAVRTDMRQLAFNAACFGIVSFLGLRVLTDLNTIKSLSTQMRDANQQHEADHATVNAAEAQVSTPSDTAVVPTTITQSAEPTINADKTRVVESSVVETLVSV